MLTQGSSYHLYSGAGDSEKSCAIHLLKSRRSFLLEYHQNIHHRASVLFVGLDTYESLTLVKLY